MFLISAQEHRIFPRLQGVLRRRRGLFFLGAVRYLYRLYAQELLRIFNANCVSKVLTTVRRRILVRRRVPSRLPFHLLCLFFCPTSFDLIVRVRVVNMVIVTRCTRRTVLHLRAARYLLREGRFLQSRVLRVAHGTSRIKVLNVSTVCVPL